MSKVAATELLQRIARVGAAAARARGAGRTGLVRRRPARRLVRVRNRRAAPPGAERGCERDPTHHHRAGRARPPARTEVARPVDREQDARPIPEGAHHGVSRRRLVDRLGGEAGDPGDRPPPRSRVGRCVGAQPREGRRRRGDPGRHRADRDDRHRRRRRARGVEARLRLLLGVGRRHGGRGGPRPRALPRSRDQRGHRVDRRGWCTRAGYQAGVRATARGGRGQRRGDASTRRVSSPASPATSSRSRCSRSPTPCTRCGRRRSSCTTSTR